MFEFLFLLSHPNHRLYKMGDGPHRELLEFHDAKIVQEIPSGLSLSVERSNGEQGDRFSTFWETVKWSDIQFAYTVVTIHNIDALNAETGKPGEQNEERDVRDLIIIDRSFGVHAHVFLPSERFSRLLQMNWRERRLNLFLTMNSELFLEGLKFPYSETDRADYRKGKALTPDEELGFLKIEMEGYNIVMQEMTDQVRAETT
jgi:hypothetical protein